MRQLRLGTRRSRLAMAQSGGVAATLIAEHACEVDLVDVTTYGDVSAAPLEQIGGTGVFVSALREALLRGEVDLAVHSYKDLPTGEAPGLTIAAVPPRADPRDALVARGGHTLGELPRGSRVATGSPRRVAQIRALGLGLELVGIRGNVDNRLARVDSGEVDAVVLARAGLLRLDRLDAITEVLDPLQVLPAPGQGALAVECREDDKELLELLAILDDPDSRVATAAERSLLEALEAGCSAPVGGLAFVAEGDDGLELFLRGSVTAIDGSEAVRQSVTGSVTGAEEVGRRLAADLLADGAADLMGARE